MLAQNSFYMFGYPNLLNLMKKITLLGILAFLLVPQLSMSQSINNWVEKKETEISTNLKRETVPNKYKTFRLDINALKSNLKNAVIRDDHNNLSHTALVSFPFSNGQTETFIVEKVNVLHPDLGAKYPEIQSYLGRSIDNRLNTIHFSIYNDEFRGLITGERTIYIDPYAKKDVENYIVYNRSDFDRKSDDNFACNVKEEDLSSAVPSIPGYAQENSTDGKLRTYRIAVACTSEYTAYHGNTIADALAAINTTITRVNSVYRKELGVIFQVVASNNRLIYRNNFNIDSTPDPDPYDNYDGGQMLNANTANITGLITVGAYDIGHVFSTGGGGIAGTAPCNTNSKGNGVTGIVTPEFDPFDIDYVCHEIGHQFGAGHTQNNACQRSTASAMEPGSGSTILGYAGICPPNIQNNSDDYFHAISISQMTATINGNTCELETTINNAEPVIATITNRTIPKSTPFILTASATDANGDIMTYCWEQMNNGTTSGTMPPVATSTDRPNFRSFYPTTSPSRTFPNLTDLINNVTPTWEVLPSVGRAMSFRVTVRDNNPLGGQTSQGNVTVTVGTAGPFAVTAPNTSQTWYVGETKAITWSVNSTNTTTYSTTVNIRLSTDGGLTYPILLASATANDGTENITVPNNIGTRNRIKVEAAANIFFDISNANFEIKSNKFELTSTQTTTSVCKPASGVYTINYVAAPSFTETVTFSAVGLPTGATASFSPTTRNSSGTVTMTINGISSVATGSYNFNCNGTSTTGNINFPVTLKVFDSNIGTIIPTTPENGAENQQTSVLLQWNALSSAASYTIEIAANPSFSTLLETATAVTNSYQTTSLSTGTINYWRVRPVNSCTTGAYSQTFSFQIASDYCTNYTDDYFEGNAIWEEGSTNAVIAKIDVPDDVIISELSFYMRASHESLADLKMQLSGPTGIFAEIFNRDCSGADINVTFDDDGVPLACGNIDPNTVAGLEGIQQASQPLAKFDGSSSLGTWTLLATDRGANTSGGTFHEFSVTICGKLQIVNNISVSSSALNVNQGSTIVIPQSKLAAAQPSTTASNLIYTITQLPTNGLLKNNGVTLQSGSTFTQSDINNSLITYVHNNANTNPENFKFTVTGLNSAFLGGETFDFIITACNISNTASQVNVKCYGQNTGSATVIASGGSGNYTYLWSPSGGNAETANALSAGNYSCLITDSNGCTKTQIFNITQPDQITNGVSQANVSCYGQNTGSATVIASGGSGNYTYLWSPSGGNAATANALSAGNYSCLITDSNGCTKTQIFNITQPVATIWNGAGWSNGIPTSGTKAIFNSNFTSSGDLTACSIEVNGTAVVTVLSGHDFNIANKVTVAQTATLVFQNNANLIQVDEVANSGNITSTREAMIRRLDYVYWGSPVSGQNLLDFSSLTMANRFYTLTELTNTFAPVIPSTTDFEIAKGYMIRAPNTFTTAISQFDGTFTGIPNNGTKTTQVTNSGSGFNMIGNPYPSPIDARLFLNSNPGTLYFWTHTNQIPNGSSNYATFNTLGATAAAAGGEAPNGTIQVGQGFLIKKSAGGSAIFTNIMRIGNNDGQFYRTNPTETHRLWLNLNSTISGLNQMLLGYSESATQGFDESIDGLLIDSGSSISSRIGESNYTIQGRALPFDVNDIVPLNFKASFTGDYTLSIDHFDGLFAGNQEIYLKDKSLNLLHNIKQSPYTFTSDAGTFPDRFEIVYTNSLLSINPSVSANDVVIYTQNGILNLKSFNTEMNAVKIFDIRGRLIYQKSGIASNFISLTDFSAEHQVVLVQIECKENISFTKKAVH